jgi:hypothetical protein
VRVALDNEEDVISTRKGMVARYCESKCGQSPSFITDCCGLQADHSWAA